MASESSHALLIAKITSCVAAYMARESDKTKERNRNAYFWSDYVAPGKEDEFWYQDDRGNCFVGRKELGAVFDLTAANFTLKSSVGNNGKIDIYPNEFVPGRHVVHYILRTEQTSIASGQTFVTNVWVEETYDDDAMVYSIKSQAADEPTLLFQSSVQPLPTTIHQPLVALFNNFLQSFQSHDLDNLMSLHANNNDRVTSINLLPGPLTHGKQALRTQYSLLMQLGLHTFNLLSPVYTPTPNKAFAKISMEFTDPTYPALFGNSPECILGMMTNDHGEIVRVWRTETMGTFEFARRLASAGRNLVAEMDKGVDSVRGR